jgi:chlorite dismutase
MRKNGDMSDNTNERPAGVVSNVRIGKRAVELNEVTRYALWSVFKVRHELPASDDARADLAAEVETLFAELAKDDVVVRGSYDVSGFRHDADFMFWLHAESSDALQDAYQRFRRTAFGRLTEPVWSQMALHRPAEFNKSHVPAFVADETPRGYIAVYPFVRGYEWYLLEDTERRRLLAEHGMMSREYPDVRANTVPAFALGDYEWILAFEADALDRIVDLMRHLRGSETRRHVRLEVPFYTGKRRSIGEIVAALP